MLVGIWFSIETIASTFYGIPLIFFACLIGLLIGLLISRKPSASEGWGDAFETRNVFQRQRKLTYVFFVVALISFTNVTIFTGESEVTQARVIEKHERSGKSTSYILSIISVNRGRLGLNVGERFWDNISNGELIEITIQRNILGFYVVTEYEKANKPM